MIPELLRTLKKEYFASILEMAISGGVASILGAMGGLVVARYISPEVSGEFRYYGLPLLYWPLFHLATFDALHRLVPALIGSGDMEKLEKHINAATVWNGSVCILGSVIFILLAIFEFTRGNTKGVIGWSIQVLFIWNVLFGGMIAAIYRGYGQFKKLARIGLFISIISFAGVALLPWFGYYGMCIRFGVVALVQLLLYYKYMPTHLNMRTSLADLSNTIKQGAPYWFWATLAAIAWFAAEGTLVYLWGGASYLGYLAIATMAREAISIIPSSCNQLVVTVVSNRFGSSGGKGVSISSVVISTVALVVITSIMCYVAGYVFAVIAPMFFPKYVSAIPFLRVYVFGAAVLAMEIPVHVLFAESKSREFGIGVVLGIITMVVVAVVLYPLVHPVYAIIVGALLGRFARGIAAIMSIKYNKSMLPAPITLSE